MDRRSETSLTCRGWPPVLPTGGRLNDGGGAAEAGRLRLEPGYR